MQRVQYATQALLHLSVEGGEPRREHYAVHLAFSLINGVGAAANAGVVAAVFALVFSLFSLLFFPFVSRGFFHFPSFLPFTAELPDFHGAVGEGEKWCCDRGRAELRRG